MSGSAARLIEVPNGWENGGDFAVRFDGIDLEVDFGDEADRPVFVRFGWVRSFRYVSEATLDAERDRWDVTTPLLGEAPLPDARNPSVDYYGDCPEAGKSPPRLFRLFHYKAGLIEVVASDWCRK